MSEHHAIAEELRALAARLDRLPDTSYRPQLFQSAPNGALDGSFGFPGGRVQTTGYMQNFGPNHPACAVDSNSF